jgi:small-conductance mechanosensitive channel
VTEIGLFATTLTNKDGVAIYVPNAKVWDDRILNYGRLPRRKFSVNIGVAYDTDLRQAVRLGLESLNAHDFVLTDELAPECYVDSFGESAVNLSFRGWVENENYATRASELRTTLKEALDKAGMEIPLPQRVVINKSSASKEA